MRLARPAFSGWLPEDHRFETAAWPLTVSLLVTIHLALLSPAGQSLPLKTHYLMHVVFHLPRHLFILGCAGSSFQLLLCVLFSSCGKWGLLSSWGAWLSHCGGLSSGEWVPEGTGFGIHSSQALEHRFSSCGTQAQLPGCMWGLPGPGVEPRSPALTGGLFTTEPPGKP